MEKKASTVPFRYKQDGLACSVLKEWNKSDFKTVLDLEESVAHRILQRGQRALFGAVCSGLQNGDKAKYHREGSTRWVFCPFVTKHAWWAFRAMIHWVGSHKPLHWYVPNVTSQANLNRKALTKTILWDGLLTFIQIKPDKYPSWRHHLEDIFARLVPACALE